MTPQQQIAITSIHQTEKARQLARKLGLAFIEKGARQPEFILLLDETGLSIKRYHNQISQILKIDFLSDAIQRRLKTSGKNQPLAKAIGVKAKQTLNVIDMTAGLGRDAFLLAAFGCQVTLIEQSPIVAALLDDALARARQNETINTIVKRINLITGDSQTLLSSLPQPDVIYLDPMFPERKKSALVKKDMQILQALLGHSNKPESLLESALAVNAKRVVIKRPKLASFVSDNPPDLQFKSKTHRFDVYIKK